MLEGPRAIYTDDTPPKVFKAKLPSALATDALGGVECFQSQLLQGSVTRTMGGDLLNELACAPGRRTQRHQQKILQFLQPAQGPDSHGKLLQLIIVQVSGMKSRAVISSELNGACQGPRDMETWL